MRDRSRRLGILGGTFNPIHMGHLIASQSLVRTLDLDQLLLVPAHLPPHKDHAEVIPSHHRYNMALLASLPHPRCRVSSIEVERGGISYSIDTVRALRDQQGEEAEFLFIVGADAMREIASWYSVDELLRACQFVVTTRPGYLTDDLVDVLNATVPRRYPQLEFKEGERDARGRLHSLGVSASPYPIRLVEVPSCDVSASEIRRRLAAGESVTYLVPETVDAYIKKYALYRPCRGARGRVGGGTE